MAATETPYRVRSLLQEAYEGGDDKAFVHLGRALDVGAFGVGAAFQRKAGESVIPDHHEAGPGGDRHEELYVVVQGSARFTVAGDEVDAAQGTAVFVHDPAAMRGAVATAEDTLVLAVGGPRGAAYRVTPAQAQEGFWDAYRAKDYEAALASTKRARSSCIRATRTCSTTSAAWRRCSATTTQPSRRSPNRSPNGSRTRSRRGRTTTSVAA